MKASGLASQERQNVLTQTGNSTSFLSIRRALRTLYAEEGADEQAQTGWRGNPRVWWNDADENWDGAEDDMAWEAYDSGYHIEPWPKWFAEDESWD